VADLLFVLVIIAGYALCLWALRALQGPKAR
jgi:hypothetical protein